MKKNYIFIIATLLFLIGMGCLYFSFQGYIWACVAGVFSFALCGWLIDYVSYEECKQRDNLWFIEYTEDMFHKLKES